MIDRKCIGKVVLCLIKLSVFPLLVYPLLHHPGGDACEEAGVRAVVSVLTPPRVVVA